jgi:hypothetical protein
VHPGAQAAASKGHQAAQHVPPPTGVTVMLATILVFLGTFVLIVLPTLMALLAG